MTNNELKCKIVDIASEQIGVELTDDIDLKSSGLDSLSLVILIAGMEEAFGITFDDDDLQPENLVALADLVALAGKYL